MERARRRGGKGPAEAGAEGHGEAGAEGHGEAGAERARPRRAAGGRDRAKVGRKGHSGGAEWVQLRHWRERSGRTGRREQRGRSLVPRG
ncbi:hypothetical protein Aph02nite_04070 [Actinoplanes philippinensis]|nr:hypothetical protein Aph02nite_04070 [Actinoplanes philippinensis]